MVVGEPSLKKTFRNHPRTVPLLRRRTLPQCGHAFAAPVSASFSGLLVRLVLDVSDLRFSRCYGSAKVFNLLCLSF